MIQPLCPNLANQCKVYIEKNPEKVLLATVGVMAAALFASMAALLLSPAFTGTHFTILVTSTWLLSAALTIYVIAKDLGKERPPNETRYPPMNDPVWQPTWKYDHPEHEYPYYNWEWGWRQRPNGEF